MWTETHEFSHQMQKLAPKEWARYRNYVINLKEKNGTYDDDLETYENTYGKISETELQDEMACDYTDQLFKNEKDLLDFINHSKSLATKVKDIWFKVLDKLNISHKEDARSLWEKCYKEASSRANKGESRKSGDVRYKKTTGEKIYDAETEQFTVEDSVKKAFEDKIDAWLRGDVKNDDYFDLGKTPVILYELGADNLPVVFGSDVMWKMTGGKHGIAIDDIKKLPQALNNPLMVFKSSSVNNAFVVITELSDKVGDPVIAAIHLNKYQKRLKINRIASAYGKENIEKFLDVECGKGNLKYVDKIKSQQWSTNRGLQLPKLVQSITDNNIILQKETVVNTYSMQNGGNNSQNGRSRISSAAEANRENLNSAAEYARTHAAELAKENARLRKTIEDMHLQLLQNDGSGVNMDVVRDVAKDIKEGYYSNVNAKELQRELAGLYTYMQGRDVDGDEVNRRARAIADKVVENALIKKDELYNEYGDLLDRIKNTRIRVSDYDKADFKDGFEYYRKHYTMGKLRLTNDGMELDVFWDELAKDYPHLIENDMYGAEERLNRLLEIRWVLATHKVITDSNLWMKKCQEDTNVYWLCHKMANKIQGTL